MDVTELAAVLYAGLTALVVVFQVALALGAPWGAYAMGGAVPGRLPPRMRAAALVQAVLLAALAWVVLSAAGVVAGAWTGDLPWLAWLPVVVAAVSVGLNAISRSAGERRLWVPVGVGLLVTSLVVALSTR